MCTQHPTRKYRIGRSFLEMTESKRLCLLESHFRAKVPSPEWSVIPPRSSFIFKREDFTEPEKRQERDEILFALTVQHVRAVHAAKGRSELTNHVWARLKGLRSQLTEDSGGTGISTGISTGASTGATGTSTGVSSSSVSNSCSN